MKINTDVCLSKIDSITNSPYNFVVVVTRQHYDGNTNGGYVLSPSWVLLTRYKKNEITFYEFAEELLKEWYEYDARLIAELKRLTYIANRKTLYLVCVEQDKTVCHREIIKALLLGWSAAKILGNIVQNDNRLFIDYE